MSEKPILFSAPMVRAILAGRKTMTRRALKNQPVELPDFNKGSLSICVGGSKYTAFQPEITALHCPHGKPGDRLWVRESWRVSNAYDHLPPRDIPQWYPVEYEATSIVANKNVLGKLRPSIFMPRWASRINLELTAVLVERLQDITEEDAMAEGCQWTDNGPRKWMGIDIGFEIANKVNGWKEGFSHIGETLPEKCFQSARQSFGNLWESINGKVPGKAWDDNPFVFVESFKVV